ncbi:Hypothetical predicted protein, partial [Pelobates cultripes]
SSRKDDEPTHHTDQAPNHTDRQPGSLPDKSVSRTHKSETERGPATLQAQPASLQSRHRLSNDCYNEQRHGRMIICDPEHDTHLTGLRTTLHKNNGNGRQPVDNILFCQPPSWGTERDLIGLLTAGN